MESSGYSSKTHKKGSCPYASLDKVLRYNVLETKLVYTGRYIMQSYSTVNEYYWQVGKNVACPENWALLPKYLVFAGFWYLNKPPPPPPKFFYFLLYWRNGLLKNRVGRSVFFFFFFLPSSMPIYITHTYPEYIHKNIQISGRNRNTCLKH